ncbi:MAG TPA: PP2C family serine/threonine-protein phosphatase [Polyangiaceae bacterium]
MARRASCPACTGERDDGDGFCVDCGHRLVFASGAPQIPPTETVGQWAVGQARAPDDFEARGEAGRAIVVVGAAQALASEVSALQAMREDPRFPQVLEHSSDARFGSFLALSPPPRGARPLVDAAPTLSLEAALDVVRQALDTAEVLERARFDWAPMRSDAFLDDRGRLVFARLRSGRRLGPRERLDARAVTEAVGGALLPEPGVRGTPRMVRFLSAHYVVEAERACTLDGERAEMAAVAKEVAEPHPPDRARSALLSDRGMKRSQNEDSASVEVGEGWTVMVVCDGVSSSNHAREASEIASATACATLAHIARSRELAGAAGLQAVSTAIRAAHAAVCSHDFEARPTGEPPGTTIVLALVTGKRAVVGWVGDSRAYWVTRDGGDQLTHDHTWLNEAVASGEWTELQALQQPLAHALTRCLGPLEWGGSGAVEPDVRERVLDGPGFLLLCTDGLWNYFPTGAELAKILDPSMGVGEAAERLVNHALAAGAHDNVTVAVHRYGQRR